MSFLGFKKWFQKYGFDIKLLWFFVLFLAVGGLSVCLTKENRGSHEKNELYSYRLEYKGNKDVTAAEVYTDQLSKLNARYALLMDAANCRVLYEKNGYEQAPMASTTKIMTLIIALENGNLDDIVTVSSYAVKMPKVRLGMKAKEQYRLRDLLYSLMLESHNDTAVAIAEHIGGTVEGFAALMNEKAQELGAYETHFVTPNGLDADGHYTTAYDLALIASYAIQNETFLEIIQTPSHSFHEQTTGRNFTVHNKDQFLNSYSGAIGIKTGFTGKAGYCFVGAAKREEKQFVSVVLASGWPPNKSYKWKDTKALMNYGMDYFHKKEVLAEGTAFQQISVLDSIEESPVTPYVKESVSLLLKDDEQVDFDIKLPKKLSAPVKKDQTIGEITIYVNGSVYKVLPLFSDGERTKLTYQYVLEQIAKQYFRIVK
ncbi:MAG: D-alanyl-D-alanine carboxypeptidase [Clostridium sp.]|nr:D-alanyl-D-alanine carboxypeptidase [Clostridium sp.]